MSRAKKLILILLFAGVTFLLSNFYPKAVHADDSNVVEYQGVLEKHSNPKYTHKLAGQNVNFILASKYNVFEGQEVKVQVKFTVGNKFLVVSIVPVQQSTQVSQPTTGNAVTFQGRLVKNPNPPYTHKLEGQRVNFILGDQYLYLEGKNVKVEVEFYSANKFRVVSMVEIN